MSIDEKKKQLITVILIQTVYPNCNVVQLTGAPKYTDCISAEG